MPKCFISYRRERPFAARAVNEKLKSHFGSTSTFFDIDGIAPGGHFPEIIRQSLGDSDVIFVTIDEEWLVDRRNQRRLNNPEDWVRREIETALQMELPVIPLLVGNAAMPAPEELPESLRILNEFQFIRLRNEEFDTDVSKIIVEVERRAELQRRAQALLHQTSSNWKKGNWAEINRQLTTMVKEWGSDQGGRKLPQLISKRIAVSQRLMRAWEAFQQRRFALAHEVLSGISAEFAAEHAPANMAWSLVCADVGARAVRGMETADVTAIREAEKDFGKLRQDIQNSGIELVPGFEELARFLTEGHSEVAYQSALVLVKEGRFHQARAQLGALGNYKDAAKLLAQCDVWAAFFQRARERNWDEAKAQLAKLGDGAANSPVQRWRRWTNTIRRCVDALDKMGRSHIVVAEGVPWEGGANPYTVVGVAPTVTTREVLDLSFRLQEKPGGMRQQERNACDALRLEDKRLLVDFATYHVTNPTLAARIADKLLTVTADTNPEQVLAMFAEGASAAQPDRDGDRGPVRRIADQLGPDGPLLLILLGLADAAVTELEQRLRTAPDDWRALHHLALAEATRISAPAAAGDDCSEHWQRLTYALGGIFGDLGHQDDGFWHHWWIDRKSIYSDVSKAQVLEARERLMRFWLDETKAADANFDVGLALSSEIEGASAASAGGGIPLDAERRACLGFMGVRRLGIEGIVSSWTRQLEPGAMDPETWQHRVCLQFSELGRVATLTALKRNREALTAIEEMRSSARGDLATCNPSFALMANPHAQLNLSVDRLEMTVRHRLACEALGEMPPATPTAIEQWRAVMKLAAARGQHPTALLELQRAVLARIAELEPPDDVGKMDRHEQQERHDHRVAIAEAIRDEGWHSDEITDALVHVLLDRALFVGRVHDNHEAARNDARRAWYIQPGTLRALRGHYAFTIYYARDAHFAGRPDHVNVLLTEAAELYSKSQQLFPDDSEIAQLRAIFDEVVELSKTNPYAGVKGITDGQLDLEANMHVSALLHKSRQEFAEAIAIYKAILQQAPSDSQIKTELATCYRALVLTKVEQKAPAEEVRDIILEALQSCPDSDLLNDFREAVEKAS